MEIDIYKSKGYTAHLGEKLFNMTEMKYRAGNKVRIKSLDWYNENKGMNGLVGLFTPSMKKLCGMVVTLDSAYNGKYTAIEKDAKGYYLDDSMIEGLVEEDVDLIPKFGEFSDNEPLDIPTMTTDFIKEHGLPCPDGYQFKDENGNIINATKIVLEKKKKEYPKTYEECCKVMDCAVHPYITADEPGITSYYEDYLNSKVLSLRKLLICRDAYWKIAGEEMGLGKPWEPDWDDDEWPDMYYISFDGKHIDKEKGYPCCNMILIFPTEEMRNAFYENFKEEIESCKELL